MHCEKPDGKTYGPTAEIVQITAEFPTYSGVCDVVVDEVPGRPQDALVHVKQRIRETVLNAGRP